MICQDLFIHLFLVSYFLPPIESIVSPMSVQSPLALKKHCLPLLWDIDIHSSCLIVRL